MKLTAGETRRLRIQTAVDWLAYSVLGPLVVMYLRLWRGYRIDRMAEVRRAFDAATRLRRPTVICANHLTLIDSLLIHHALSSLGQMLVDFRRYSWNVPAVENMNKNLFLRLLGYLGKTIPIDRGGAPEHHREVLDKLIYLVERGHMCTIFPEGGRSRTGRIEPEHVTYGVGQILKELRDPLVVCVYLRGERQRTWGDLPARGDRIRVELERLDPRTEATGLRAARELSRQIILKLKDMEQRFAADVGLPAPAAPATKSLS